MRTIESRAVRFGELAGPLVHGSAFFDWALVSTQTFAAAMDAPLEDIIRADAIPYAPVAVSGRVDRYPGLGDAVAVETTPVGVGDHGLDLRYDVLDAGGDPYGTVRIRHVTVAPDGSAEPLPGDLRERVRERLPGTGEDSDRDGPTRDERTSGGPAGGAPGSDGPAGGDPAPGPGVAGSPRDGGPPPDADPTYGETFEVRRPHIEGSELAYFEEYPRFATVALERHLDRLGVPLADLRGEREPFRLRGWEWAFHSPVAYGTALDVTGTVTGVTEEAVRVAHRFADGGRTLIEGRTEYGCFDRGGEPAAFDDAVRAALVD